VGNKTWYAFTGPDYGQITKIYGVYITLTGDYFSWEDERVKLEAKALNAEDQFLSCEEVQDAIVMDRDYAYKGWKADKFKADLKWGLGLGGGIAGGLAVGLLIGLFAR
jgi:hypothetical protein